MCWFKGLSSGYKGVMMFGDCCSPRNGYTMNVYPNQVRFWGGWDNYNTNFNTYAYVSLYDNNWQLWLIDHTRAFGQEKRLLKPKEIRRCSVSLWEKLQALDEDLLTKAVGPYIGDRRVAAVMARRDKILSHLQKRMASEGRDTVLFHMPEP